MRALAGIAVVICIVLAAAAILTWAARRSPTKPGSQAKRAQRITPLSMKIRKLMNRRSFFLLTGIAVAAVTALGLLLRPGGDGPAGPLAALPSVTAAAEGTASPGASSAGGGEAAAPDATPRPAGIDVSRIVVPGLGIDAPIVTLGVDQYGTMEAPGTPTDVAWYSFSARPGDGSNVVMSGHLDYVNYGPAVFYRLRDARTGDDVHLVLADGSLARYRVLDVTTYDEATAPVEEIVGPTDREIVTLITCGGSFDRLAREYDKRVVLRAERVADTARTN